MDAKNTEMFEKYTKQFHSTLNKLLEDKSADRAAVDFLTKLRKEIVCRILGFGWDRWRGELSLEDFKKSTKLGELMVGRIEAATNEWLLKQTAELGTIELTPKENEQLRNLYRRTYIAKLKQNVTELAWANAEIAAEIIVKDGAFGVLPTPLTKFEKE